MPEPDETPASCSPAGCSPRRCPAAARTAGCRRRRRKSRTFFPNYEILSMLGRGGMGAVYKARQTALDRLVAIKLLPLEISVDRDFADRFRREARAMAKLNHPHIISVFDFGQTGEGHLFFAMEFVEGANLHDIIHGPGLAPDQALVIAAQICTALAYAHGKGVVHRDIKPANVMLDTDSQVKVADFGLARPSSVVVPVSRPPCSSLPRLRLPLRPRSRHLPAAGQFSVGEGETGFRDAV